ncbi:MAG: rhomboid family intramembrane serine protease [Flavobacteriales bacterium CG_4_10_14_0_2_um_filter_32_8]|nr:MAG: rhomboid family intramembrane serine protease [Flavobacteriales bacterium CG_4_10_14_0_2_um_filter_32_8]PJB16683.1 MAG: rhomboid family intramembrane serine protease [Flavobacteriales bacterium CG_4_9_14_3_um_filter_32_8]
MSNPFIDDIKNQYKNGSALIKLIMVNIAVFVGIHLLGLILWLFNIENGTSILISWLALPADLNTLIYKPWTIITYMFLHEQFMHILFNLLVLYFGGQIFTQFLSQKKLVVTYILGGFVGGLFYLLAFNLLPVFKDISPLAVALGASASVMAILVAAATYVPNFVVRLLFFGNVKFKYIAIGYVVLDLISIPQSNAGGHIAHLGGALFGFFYIQQLKKGKDFTVGFSRWLDYLKNLFKLQKKMKVVYKKTGQTKSDYDYNAQKLSNQKKVDSILDKIAKSGYDSLTADEKAILFDASKK